MDQRGGVGKFCFWLLAGSVGSVCFLSKENSCNSNFVAVENSLPAVWLEECREEV